MIGGTSALEMIRPTTTPHTIPIAIAITNARNVLEICSYFRSIPMLIPESASVDMIEISIPPTSITHSIPSDITIVTALFFSISISDLGVRNDGLIAVMITKRTIRTTASSASREPVIFFMTDFFSIIQHPLYVLFPLRVQGFFPV